MNPFYAAFREAATRRRSAPPARGAAGPKTKTPRRAVKTRRGAVLRTLEG